MGSTNRPKRVMDLNFYNSRSQLSEERTDGESRRRLDEFNTGAIVRSEIAIDAAVQHRKWRFNELVVDAVGRVSIEHLDASINLQGKFRKHNKNKADGTLEVTLEGVNFGSGPEDCHGAPGLPRPGDQ